MVSYPFYVIAPLRVVPGVRLGGVRGQAGLGRRLVGVWDLVVRLNFRRRFVLAVRRKKE